MAFTADDFQAPNGLRTDEFLLRPIVSSDAELDYEAVMESKDFLRVWEGTGWPEDGFTVEANQADMAKMEKRHNERHSFGYTVMNLDETQCLGCVYIFPTDVNWLQATQIAPIDDAQWSDYDTALYFWIRTSRLADQLDHRLLEAVRLWLKNDWPIKDHVVVTSEPLDQQVATIQNAGLQLKFRLTDEDDPTASLAFA